MRYNPVSIGHDFRLQRVPEEEEISEDETENCGNLSSEKAVIDVDPVKEAGALKRVHCLKRLALAFINDAVTGARDKDTALPEALEICGEILDFIEERGGALQSRKARFHRLAARSLDLQGKPKEAKKRRAQALQAETKSRNRGVLVRSSW